MTDKQMQFCKEYLLDSNGKQAAIRAGYSAKTAKEMAANLLTKVNIQNEIRRLMEVKDAELIASQDEVLKYLTAVLRGESEAEIVVVEGDGGGCSSARRIHKAPDERERLKAAELLGKRYMLFTDRAQIDVNVPVLFEGCDHVPD